MWKGDSAVLNVALRGLPERGLREVMVGVILGEVIIVTPVWSCVLVVMGVGAVKDGVSIYSEGGGAGEVGFCKNEYVNVVLFHVVNDGVDFGWFPEACDIPLAYPDEFS